MLHLINFPQTPRLVLALPYHLRTAVSDGVKGQMDKCQELIKKTAEDQKAELTACPKNYLAIDGAMNFRTLCQVAISSKKSVGKAHVDELISFVHQKRRKLECFFHFPTRQQNVSAFRLQETLKKRLSS
eukprot:jgi/Bigna1/147226/aug1.133_g21934